MSSRGFARPARPLPRWTGKVAGTPQNRPTLNLGRPHGGDPAGAVLSPVSGLLEQRSPRTPAWLCRPPERDQRASGLCPPASGLRAARTGSWLHSEGWWGSRLPSGQADGLNVLGLLSGAGWRGFCPLKCAPCSADTCDRVWSGLIRTPVASGAEAETGNPTPASSHSRNRVSSSLALLRPRRRPSPS